MADPAFKQSVSAGVQAFQRGDLAAAIDHLREALAHNPEDAEALSLMGVALVYAGRAREAEAPLRRAVEKEPLQPGFRINLAQFHRESGQPDLAIEQLKWALARQPKNAGAWKLLGEAHIDRQEFQEAADALDEALQIDGGNLAIALRLATALAAAGHYPAAFHALEHADKISPDSPDVMEVRLNFSRANRDWGGLQALAERMIKLAPDNPRGWRDLAIAFYENGLTRASMQAFETVLELEGRTPVNLVAYGRVALNAGRPKEAASALDEAESLGGGGNVDFLSAQALRMIHEGRLEEAEAYAERAVAADPNYVPVYPHLSALRRGRLEDNEKRALRKVVADSALALSTRSMASFVLGHGEDAEGAIDSAFAEYQRANDLARQQREAEQVRYDPAATEAHIANLFGRTKLAGEGSSAEAEGGDTPIFIVGAPRSGTTLVESIVASHSQVRLGGELPMIITLMNEFLKRGDEIPLPLAKREAYIEAYWREAPPLNGAPYLTDKGLFNLECAGLIAQLFPKSPIIFVRRNPLETGLSMFRHEFTKQWACANNLDHIGHFLGQTARMADHWGQELGERFTVIQYEDLARDFDGEARRLVAKCGLEWEDACGARDGGVAAAATISAVQAREPVELREGRAKAYARHLEPLKRALEAADIDLETGVLKR